MPPRLLTPAFLLVILCAAAAHADPLVVTAGSFSADGQSPGSKQVAISGPNFSFSASSPFPALVLPSVFPGGALKAPTSFVRRRGRARVARPFL